MMNYLELRKILLEQCAVFVADRERTIAQIINSNQQGLSSETKSSAGDKHETGRAMLQLEMEKAGQQLEGVYMLKRVLAKMVIGDKPDVIKLGSLIITSQATYFLAISVGEIRIAGKTYYAISPSSPIGKLLLGKKEKDTFVFRGKSIRIDKVY